jgi:hypothetical protein
MARTALPAAASLAELWRNMITAVNGPGSTTDTALESLMNQFATSLYTYTAGSPGLSLAPNTAVGESMPRMLAEQSVTIAVSSGTLYLVALPLAVGTVVNNINFVTGTTASSGVTHNWALLANSARVPVAVSADNTTTDLTASTVQTYAVATVAAGAATSYTVPSSGLYYAGFMIATGTTQPTMIGYTGAGTDLNNIAPKLAGASNTGATTPPSSFSSALTAITASASALYAYIT